MFIDENTVKLEEGTNTIKNSQEIDLAEEIYKQWQTIGKRW